MPNLDNVARWAGATLPEGTITLHVGPCNMQELHRWFSEVEGSATTVLKKCSTTLWPGVALLNHSQDPNTVLVPTGSDEEAMTALFADSDIARPFAISYCYVLYLVCTLGFVAGSARFHTV